MKTDKHSTGGVGDTTTAKSINAFWEKLSTRELNYNIFNTLLEIQSKISTNLFPYLERLNKNSNRSIYQRLVTSEIISETSYYNYKNNKTIPNESTLVKILNVFGLQFEDFLEYINPKYSKFYKNLVSEVIN